MSRAQEAAAVVHGQIQKAVQLVGIRQEKATSISNGLARTTDYLPDSFESLEYWPMIDSLDSIAVNDPVALSNIGGKTIVLGKIAAAIGMARIRRKIALTGADSTFSLPGGHTAGAGANLTGSEGNDNSGVINLTAGTSPAIGTIFRIAFSSNRDNTKYNVFLSSRNANARSLGGVVGPVTINAGYAEIETRTALTNGVTYIWGYLIVGYE